MQLRMYMIVQVRFAFAQVRTPGPLPIQGLIRASKSNTTLQQPTKSNNPRAG